MDEDRREELKMSGLRPDLQGPETDASQQPASPYTTLGQSGTYYPSAGYAPPAPAGATKTGWRWAIVGVAAAATVTAGVWYGMSSPPHPPPANAVTAPSQTDEPKLESNGAADYKATEYLKSVLGGKASGMSRGGATADQAGTSNGDNPLHAANAAALINLDKTAPEMADEIRSGKRVPFKISLSDEFVEDSYHVKFYLDGVDLGEVYYKHEKALLPLIPGKPALLKVVLTMDRGGNGVSVGLKLPSGEFWRTSIIHVGESDQKQITAP